MTLGGRDLRCEPPGGRFSRDTYRTRFLAHWQTWLRVPTERFSSLIRTHLARRLVTTNEKPLSPPLSTESGSASSPATGHSLDRAMRADRRRLGRLRKRLSPQEFNARLSESIRLRESREAAPLRLEHPPELPISSHRDELVRLIRERQVIVVCGETGSGKSTQLPKFCLEAGLGREAMIGHTQPRRLAARSVASRIAEELDVRVGGEVGYQIRFGDETGPGTLVKLMTDGILLAETQSDRYLDRYDAVIIDEAHERSLNIDFLLGFLRQLQSKRPDLKIIITSATIDAERFAEHFSDDDGPAPIVNVEGRGYPVEIRYLPWEDVGRDETRGYDLATHVIAGLDSVSRDNKGDTLVFLPTERDIREVSHRVAGHYRRLGLEGRVDILPLYARLPQGEQQRIFHPGGGKRRLIFATNVAESSLTVPGIRAVVDSGTARISRYSPRSKLQRLPIEPISRASADQRAGRCGRIAPGICVRLFSEDDLRSRDAYTTPEIRRTNLASVVLKTKTLGLGSLESFPLLDPPRPEAIREGVRTLVELGAIDDAHELTEIGWQLGRMPVDPRVGRIILAADEWDALPEVLPIAAALEIQDPRDRPPGKKELADEAHAAFADPRSDFLAYLRLWRYYQQARDDLSRSKLTRELRKQFLSPTRMREWADVTRQLREIAAMTRGRSNGPGDRPGRSDKKISSPRYAADQREIVDKDRYEAIHKSLLTGLLYGVAMAGDKHEYTGAGGLKLYLWPGSGVFESKPKWIVAAELVETAKQYARTVAKIQPRWIEDVGGHLIKRSHSDPHWSQKAGGAFCYERQSLFGLPVVVRRRVPLPPIDPATARDLLIEQGLVEGDLQTNARFVRHNRTLRAAIQQLAAKTRRRDMVIDTRDVLRFYQERLPMDVCDRGRLEKYDSSVPQPEWSTRLRDAAGVSRWLESPPPVEIDESTPYMRPEDLIATTAEVIEAEDFPDTLEVGSSKLPLEYRFEPGGQRDGISLRVHRAAVSQLSDARLDWLVPGMLETKLVAMIKSLPKRIRRNLVPAADVAGRIATELAPRYGQVPFMPAVCEALSRQAEMEITPGDFQADKLEDWHRFLVEVVDDAGQPIESGREVAPIRQRLGAGEETAEAEPMTDAAESWAVDSMTSFDIDELPREVVRSRGGVQVAQYPALVDLGDAVATRLFSDAASAEAANRLGAVRLFAIDERKELRSQVRWLPTLEEAKIKLAPAIGPDVMESTLADLLARLAFVEGEPPLRTRGEFERRRRERGRRIAEATQDVAKWLGALTDGYFASRRALEGIAGERFAHAVDDIHHQLEWLLPERFLSVTPWCWLQHYPRYFSAIAYRIEKLQSGASARDAEHTETIRKLWQRWIESLAEPERNATSQAASEFRWMMEELRISLYAQPLGTSVKVSPQRCEKLLRNT